MSKEKIAIQDKDSHIYLKNIIERIPYFIFWKNLDSIYLGCNQRFAELVGKNSPDEIIGKTDFELRWGAGEPEFFRQGDLEVMHGNPKINVEEILVRPDHSRLVMLVSKVPLRDKYDHCIGVLGISTDITERKKMELALKDAKEKAEAANQAKTVFIANMSHDLRTPISGVIGMAEMLEKEGDTQKDRGFGHIIHNSSESLLSLLNDILVIVSTDVVKEENLRYETFNLKERIKHVEELFASSAKIKQVKLEIISAPDLPEYIVSDRIKIDRILLNLVSNALKFTDTGYVKLTTKFLIKNTDKVMIEFSVSDTGIGIPGDQIDKIFDRFYRVSPSYEGKYTGFGIGLFIVKKFVGLLKGKIKAESELGRGTTFTVTLPVKVGKKEVKKLEDVLLPKAPIHTSSQSNTSNPLHTAADNKQKELKILFVEDDNIAKRTGQYILESAGFKVETVGDGEEALKKIKSSQFDLVITDIGLPGIDGIELAALVRRWERKMGKPSLPIIGLSAHASSEIKKEASEVGMNLVLDKPIDNGKIKYLWGLLQVNEAASTSKDDLTIKDNAKTLGFELPATEEQLFQLEEYPLLDQKEGLKIVGDKEMLNELLDMFVKDGFPKELATIENAHKISDWECIRKVAHKLKGAALYCGTVKLRYACQYIERYLLAGYSDLREQLYQQLITVLSETSEQINTLLAKK